MVTVVQGRHIRGFSTETKPTNVLTYSTYEEVDTGNKYIFDGTTWNIIPPIPLTGTRHFTKFIPFTDQSGVTFGTATWSFINAELAGDGSMVWQARTPTTATNDDAVIRLNDFSQAEMLPKVIMKFKVDNTTSSNAVFIGFCDDAAIATLDIVTYIAAGVDCIGIGYKRTDTNWFIYHNDNAGALVGVDTGLPRDTNVHYFTIKYTTSTNVNILFQDLNMVTQYTADFNTDIPRTGIDLAFAAHIVNNDTLARYMIQMYDYIYLEKTIPVPTGVTI